MNCHVYVDFDGTIMPCDTTDFLFERFALPQWRDIEAEWAAGKIGSRECMGRQVELLRATPHEIDEAIGELEIDPDFAAFIALCASSGIGATIVSDGLDVVIGSVLARHGLDTPFFANRLVSNGSNTWRLEFPHSRDDCAVNAGHCKCARTEPYRKLDKVVIGDGRSDFCIAGRADLVLAKASLLKECRANHLPHLPFRDFREILELLPAWLDARPRDELVKSQAHALKTIGA